MNSKIILFDLDHTLIDTNKLKRIVEKKLHSVLPYSKELFLERMQAYLDQLESSLDFDPEGLAEWLSDGSEELEKKIINIFYNDNEMYAASVYPDAEDVLKSLQKDYEIGIFSQGTKRFQHAKLELSGLKKFMNEELVFIASRKTTDEFLAGLPQGSYIVDDDPNVIFVLRENKNIFPIWINRSKAERMNYVTTINSLASLKKIMDSK